MEQASSIRLRRSAQGLTAPERVLAALEAFGTEEDGSLRVSDIARRLDLGMSTASRLVGTLVAAGYAERDEKTGRYQLTHKILSLAGTALNHSRLYRESRRPLYELSCKVGLGVNLAELNDGMVYYLLHFDGDLAQRSYTLLGKRKPVHATALGKCLISRLTPSELQDLVDQHGLESYTTNTISDVSRLCSELDLVRNRGYACEREEFVLGRACIAAPIAVHRNQVLGAISISGPAHEISLDDRELELSQTIISVANRISSHLDAMSMKAE